MTDPKQKLLKRNKKVILTAKVCSKSGCLRELDGWLPNRGVKYIRTNLCQRLYLLGWLLNTHVEVTTTTGYTVHVKATSISCNHCESLKSYTLSIF